MSIQSKEIIYFEQTCRCCLAQGSGVEMLSMDATVLEIESSSTVADLLTECSFAENPYDELPHVICIDCVQKTKQAFEFKRMCQNSVIVLRNYLSEMVKTEIEINTLPELIHVEECNVNDLIDENIGDADDDYDNYEDDGLIFESGTAEEDIQVDEVSKGEDFQLVNNAKKVNGRYQCELCEKTLADRRTFLLHIRLHLGKNLKHCEICGRGFAKQNHLDRHKAIHSKKKPKQQQRQSSIDNSNSCSDVVKSDNSNNDEDQQQIGMKENKRFRRECSPKYEVSKVTQDKSSKLPLEEDETQLLNAAKEVNNRLQCPICPKTLSQRKILKLHIRNHIGKNLQHCKICEKGFAKGSNLNRHMLLHRSRNIDEEDRIMKIALQDGRYHCPYCTKILIDRQTFRLHIRLHIDKCFVRCDVCNQGFEDNLKLEEHMTTHGDQFSCNKCNIGSFKTYQERKVHLKTVHESETTDENTKTMENPQKCKNNRDDDDDGDNGDDDDEDKHVVDRSNQTPGGRYQCEFCEKTLANRTTLRYHIRLHLQKHLLKCEICNQGFSKKSHLKRHLGTHSKKKQPCRYCDAAFDTYEERKTHTVTVHKKAVHNQFNKAFITCYTQSNGLKNGVCMICDKRFTSIRELENHIRSHLANPQSFSGVDFAEKKELLSKFDFKCNEENIGAMLHEALVQNPQQVSKIYRMLNSNGWELSLSDSETDNDNEIDNDDTDLKLSSKYECAQCAERFDRLHRLMCHMKISHDQQRFREFKCPFCMQCFPNNFVLLKHRRQQCENEQKTITCSMCNCRFAWEVSLEKHLSIYHETEKKFIEDIQKNNSKPFACNQCTRSYATEEMLEAHASYHLRPKSFSCDICEKQFSRSDNLRSHMRVHLPAEERPAINKKHLCPYCGRSFSNSSNLTVHIRRHTGERPYQCKHCDARFPRSSDLTCHIRIHTKEKTCVCNVCGKGFTRSNKLVRHMRVHTGERPYKCHQCERAFTQSNDLTLHLRRHTGEKPFVCNCGQRFITNSLLQQHRRTSGHIDSSTNSNTQVPCNSVNNPHRKWHPDDGIRTGITAHYKL